MKIFLAGWNENEKSNTKPKYFLMSFYYLFNYSDEKIIKLQISNNENFLLDSGAYSFMNAKRKIIEQNPHYLDEFVNKYIEFINKWNIKYFFEMDVDNIVGYEKVLEYRNLIEIKTGKKSIPVFHKSRGLLEYKKICMNYSYVAIGTIHEYSSRPDVLKELVEMAKKYNTKVHGLGFTKQKLLHEIHFYSVDSTTLLKGTGYGFYFLFTGKMLKKVRPKGMRGKNKLLYQHNYEEWLKFQNYADKYL